MKDYPLVLSSAVLSKEVAYLGGIAEMTFYVEGLRFPDKDFDGLISINLSLLEPISAVRSATFSLCVFFRVTPADIKKLLQLSSPSHVLTGSP